MRKHKPASIQAALWIHVWVGQAFERTRGRWRIVLAGLSLFLLASLAGGQNLTPAWVELGENGEAIARIVVEATQTCPAIRVDGVNRSMSLRQPIPVGFRPVCEFTIPSGAKSADIEGQSLSLPRLNPSRIVVVGDTGCRIQGSRVQDCNDPEKWPFEAVANQAAGESAELIIHVGDYLYRESPCPAGSEAKCGEVSPGDNWDAWNADFFTPATKLLSAAPWALARGNHEDCDRSWRGWFYYLDPRPWTGTCEKYSAPYVIKLGTFELGVIDSSAVQEDSTDEKEASIYAAQLASMHLKDGWIVDHHPFWGFKSDSAGGQPAALSVPLQAAWDKAKPQGVNLILSGHIHLFEYVTLDHGRPVQLVAGDGGTDLAVPIQTSMNGIMIHGETVVSSRSKRQFGYTLMTKSGNTWDVSLKNRQKEVLVECSVPGSEAGCTSLGSD